MDDNDDLDWQKYATAQFMRALFNRAANPEDYAQRLTVLGAQLSLVRDPAILREMLSITLQTLREIVPKSMTDALTGLVNRGAYDAAVQELCTNDKPYAILVIDIDHFKSFNDRYGHDNGDHVLQTTAKRIQNMVRNSDTVARYGGEEMVVILPDTSLFDAKRIADKLRQHIAAGSLSARNGEQELPKITVSIGVAERYMGESATEVFKRADNALYDAKHNGRNRVEVHGMIDENAPVIPQAHKAMFTV